MQGFEPYTLKMSMAEYMYKLLYGRKLGIQYRLPVGEWSSRNELTCKTSCDIDQVSFSVYIARVVSRKLENRSAEKCSRRGRRRLTQILRIATLQHIRRLHSYPEFIYSLFITLFLYDFKSGNQSIKV